MDISQIMQMAGKLKEELGAAQKEAVKLEAVGETGGGLVKVTLNGQHRAVATQIDPSLLTADNKALLEDLLVAAINLASDRVGAKLKEKMGGLAQGFGIDPETLGNLGG